MESSKYGIQPDQRIQLGNYHLRAQRGTQVSRGLLRWCVSLGLETLFVLYSMLYIYWSCSGEMLQQNDYGDTFNVWLWHSILKRPTWTLIWFKPKKKSLEFINCRGSWEIHVTQTFSVLKWQFIAIQWWIKTHFLTLTTRAVILMVCSILLRTQGSSADCVNLYIHFLLLKDRRK